MSSDYCSVRETSQKDTVLCPGCGEKGKPVSLATVGAMAKTEVEAVKLSAREYQLCRNSDCPVVYYAGEVQLEKSDLRVPVNFKERNYEGAVCYCFNYTVTDIKAEIQTKGYSTAQRMITQEVKAGRCACEVKNPAGACCLGDITRAVQAVMAQVRDRRAALQTTGGKRCKNETPTPC
jgi:Zinc binding domain